jgi:putative transposase
MRLHLFFMAAASDELPEATMKDEYTDRHQAVQMRLAGQSVEHICRTLQRSRKWFHYWWGRYLAYGPDGLFDLTRANHQVARRISPELERTILTIRRRLEARAQPDTRYKHIGASTIVAELKALHICPLPCERTIERVLQRNGITLPKVRLARRLPRQAYPGPHATASNQVHQVDFVGPVYLKGKRQRHYVFVCKDVFDGAVNLKLTDSRRMDEVLVFLVECWTTLGRPVYTQFDNARELAGWGKAARYLSRVIRLCLRFGIEPVFIPPAQPRYNGSVENFNGWFQPVLFHHRFKRLADLKRELRRLQDTVNQHQVLSRLGGLTPEQYRRRLKLLRLPRRFKVSTQVIPLAAGRVTFIRQVTPYGNLHLLGQTFFVGKRLRGEYVKAVLDTQQGRLTVYRNGRVFKRWPYKLLNK